MTGYFEEVVNRISDEVFYVVFNNRELMRDFNAMISVNSDPFPEDCDEFDICSLFTSKGNLKRVKIPQWAKRAIYYRDKGTCTGCMKDISGLLHSNPSIHYDHIVPLAQGGLNDVSNLQLLCGGCNLKKGSQMDSGSSRYLKWY